MNYDDKKESSIEQLQKRLYTRGRLDSKKRRVLRRGTETEERDRWRKEFRAPSQPRGKRSYVAFIFVASVIFFALSVGISALFFLGGSNVSTKNIDIDIEGPVSIDGGETLSLVVTITNRNTITLESADLIVEYPEGTRSASDQRTELLRARESIGSIAPGERVERSISAVLFGKEGTDAAINFALEYRVKDSSAIFVVEKSYRLLLSSSPLSLSVDSLREVTSGQEMRFVVTITSNSSSAMKDVLLSAEYPFGFTFVSGSPAPAFAESVWELGDIPPQGKRTVTIRGIMEGENGDERVFRFASGIQSGSDEKKIATAFITSLETVTIQKPFVSVKLSLNNSTDETFVTSRGSKILANISFINNLPVTVTDGEIEVRIRGASLYRQSVSVDNRGFYRSIDDTIIWSKETNRELLALSPGETGSVSFSFSTLPVSSGVIPQNAEIILEIDVRGRRLSDANVPEEISSTIVRSIKVATDLLFTSRPLHFSGPFLNSGPIPPKADRETTYTIIWALGNSANAVANAQVVATIPSYVRWMDVVSPKNEQIEWNPIARRLTWIVGDMPASGNVADYIRELAFQVALTPSLSQIGSSPTLVDIQTISASDRFTETRVEIIKPPISTRLSTDPGFELGDDRVSP